MEVTLDSKDIVHKASEVIEASNKVHNLVSKGHVDIVAALADDTAQLKTHHSTLAFLSRVSPDSEIRDACHRADQKLHNHTLNLNKRKDVYTSVKKLLDSDASMDETDRAFLVGVLEGYQKVGIEYAHTDEYSKLKLIMKTLSDKIHIKSSRPIITKLKRGDLAGVPEKYLELYPYNSETKQYTIELTGTTFTSLMKFASGERVRKHLQRVYYGNNFPHAKELLELIVARHEYAKLLGFKSYTEFKSKYSMAHTEDNVRTFLNSLLTRLDQPFIREYQQLVQLKDTDTIGSWDTMYYLNVWKEMYGVDDFELREYFPVNHVVGETLKIYQELCGLKFKAVKSVSWHEDVKVYKISEESTGKMIGLVYLDLIQRSNKTAHTGCYELVPGCTTPYRSGDYDTPISSLVMNVARDGLMYFSDVVTFVSQFAHVLHHVTYRSPTALFSGLSGSADYINIPVLVFENVVWQKNNIIRLSKHFTSGKKITDTIANKMGKIRFMDTGIRLKNQILMSTFDMIVHSAEFSNTAKLLLQDGNEEQIRKTFDQLYGQLHSNIMTTKMATDSKIKIIRNSDACPVSRWNFLNTSDAGRYFTSVWSYISAADIFYTKFMGDSRSKPGIKFREQVLQYHPKLTNTEKLYRYMGRRFEVDNFLYINGVNLNSSEYSMFFKGDRERVKAKTPLALSDSDSIEDVGDIKLISDSSPYQTEDTETLPKYKAIFARHSSD